MGAALACVFLHAAEVVIALQFKTHQIYKATAKAPKAAVESWMSVGVDRPGHVLPRDAISLHN